MTKPFLYCVILLSSLLCSQIGSTTPTIVFSYEIKICVRNQGTKPLDMHVATSSLLLFPNTTWQTTSVLNTSHPILSIKSDEDGNPRLLLNISDVLEPGENVTLMAEYRVSSESRVPPCLSLEGSGHLSDVPEQLVSEFCCEAGCWTVGFEPLRKLALNLTDEETNVLKILSSFMTWIYENIAYHQFETPLYPNETYVSRMGAYDDQANLLITLCRIVGIPAYLQIGYIFTPDHQDELFIGAGHVVWKLVNIRWHAWAVAYIPPWGWLPIDLSVINGALFDPLDAIRKALIWDQHTLLLAEVKRTDYVAATREVVKFFRKHGIYVYREERLDLWMEGENMMAILWPFLIASSVILPISFVAVLLVMRSRRRSGGKKMGDR